MARRGNQHVQLNRGEPDLTRIVFRQGERGELQRDRYLAFYQRFVIATRYPDETCMRRLGIYEDIGDMLQWSNLDYFCNLRHPTIESLTLEFLSSFSYITPPGDGMYLSGVAHFRL